MKGGKKELVSDPPVSNNNNKPLGKHEEPQAGDTNDTTSNQSHGNSHSTHQDNNHTTSHQDISGDYTEQPPTNDSMTYGQ